MTIARILRVFSNETELAVWELPINGFLLPAFQAEFGVADPNNPMYDCWPVKPENVPFLEHYVTNLHGWDFDRFSYFVEADAS